MNTEQLGQFKDKVVQAYDQQASTLTAYRKADDLLSEAKATLDALKAEGLADGTIEGKNAELREASARKVLEGTYLQVERAEIAHRAARLSWELANIEVERVRALLRVLEIEAQVTNNEEN